MEEDEVFRGQRNDRNNGPAVRGRRPGSGRAPRASHGECGLHRGCRWQEMPAEQGQLPPEGRARPEPDSANLPWGGLRPLTPPLNSEGAALKQQQVPNGHAVCQLDFTDALARV